MRHSLWFIKGEWPGVHNTQARRVTLVSTRKTMMRGSRSRRPATIPWEPRHAYFRHFSICRSAAVAPPQCNAVGDTICNLPSRHVIILLLASCFLLACDSSSRNREQNQSSGPKAATATAAAATAPSHHEILAQATQTCTRIAVQITLLSLHHHHQ